MKGADFRLSSACSINGLVTARSALPQVGQIVDGGNIKPPNAAKAALLPILPPGKKKGGFCCLKFFSDAASHAITTPQAGRRPVARKHI